MSMQKDSTVRRQVSFYEQRIPIELDQTEWDAVDWIVADEGTTRTKWLRGKITDAKMSGKAVTTTIRKAIAAACMDALGKRAATPPVTGFEQANTPNDEDFADMVAAAQINGTVDLIGCTVSAGVNESGCVAFYIRNGWRDGLHMTISTPLTPAEWQERMDTDAL